MTIPPARPTKLPRPGASIIIATYNEASHIRRCLESIFAAEPFGTFEVLVVDGGSSDGTPEIVREVARTHPEVRLLSNPKRITPVGFNTGIKASSGDYIFILSAHSEYGAAYFRLCLATARCKGKANTGGWIEWVPSSSTFEGRVTRALGSSPFGLGVARFRGNAPKEGPADAVAFGCFPRWVFEKYGLHDERLELNQDTELFWRLMRAGEVQWMNPSIRVRYFGRNRLPDLLRRAWRSGRWNPFMWWVAPYTLQARHALPGVFATSLLIPGVGLASLAAHQAVAMVASVREAIRFRDPALALVLPAAFLALHAAYGFGILKGILDLARGGTPVQQPARIEFLPPLALAEEKPTARSGIAAPAVHLLAGGGTCSTP